MTYRDQNDHIGHDGRIERPRAAGAGDVVPDVEPPTGRETDPPTGGSADPAAGAPPEQAAVPASEAEPGGTSEPGVDAAAEPDAVALDAVAGAGEAAEAGEAAKAEPEAKGDKESRSGSARKRVRNERVWGELEQLHEKGEAVRGTVTEVVKGGLIVDVGLRGFLPASLVEMRRVRDLQPYVGREIDAKVIELDKARNNVVLSRRAWLEQNRTSVRGEFLQQLQKGQVRKGVVSSIVNFGAFVDLGGLDGLVNVAELSWTHIEHPSEVVQVGMEVTVEVLDVDLVRERVSLSLKATQEDPWRRFARTHAIGQIVPGKVTKLVPFGAFVRVDDGFEGLVHISELAGHRIEVPDQVVAVGDDAVVKVIDIDLDRRRISLSVRQANEDYYAEFDPFRYGMADSYDEQGNYIFPEGFDPDTNEWLEGYEEQRDEWESRYAEAERRYQLHTAQVEKLS